MQKQGFPSGSDGKASVCNEGDLGSIPGLEDPPEKGMATHSIFLPEKSHEQKSLVATDRGVTKSQT